MNEELHDREGRDTKPITPNGCALPLRWLQLRLRVATQLSQSYAPKTAVLPSFDSADRVLSYSKAD